MTQQKPSKIKSDYLSEFNTDTDESEALESSAENTSKEDFASMLSDSFKTAEKRLKVGDKIRGKILNLGSKDVFVTTGTLRDGTIQRSFVIHYAPSSKRIHAQHAKNDGHAGSGQSGLPA